MKQYKIDFYKMKKDWLPCRTEYREFPSYAEMIEWACSIAKECRYNRYFHTKITLDVFLSVTNY